MQYCRQLASTGALLFASVHAFGQAGPPDNMIDGERFPDGYTPLPQQ